LKDDFRGGIKITGQSSSNETETLQHKLRSVHQQVNYNMFTFYLS